MGGGSPQPAGGPLADDGVRVRIDGDVAAAASYREVRIKMKKKASISLAVVVVSALAVLALSPVVQAQDGKQKAEKAEKAEPSTYLIISPHTVEQCLATLDGVMAMPEGDAMLAKWEWGCMSGDHTGYMMMTVKSEEEALAMVPEAVREQAKAIKLNKFTADQIKKIHESMHEQ